MTPEAQKAKDEFIEAVKMLQVAVEQHPGDFMRILQRALEMCSADRRFVAAHGALPIPRND